MLTHVVNRTAVLSVCLVVFAAAATPVGVVGDSLPRGDGDVESTAAVLDGRPPGFETVAERARSGSERPSLDDRRESSVRQNQSAAPVIAVQPDVVRFPNTTEGPFRETVTVTNDGTAPLAVQSVLLVDARGDSFVYDDADTFTLAPNESRTVVVSFDPANATPQFASLRILSNASNAPQVDVWLANTRTVADISPSMVLADRTIVNATVQNATVNASQTVNLSWPLTRDDTVAVDALTLTPLRPGDFDLSVSKSSDRLADAPAFDLTDGTESPAFVRVDHTIDNANVSDVDVAFRVRKDLLAGNETGPEDVALYRYQNGSWTELPTTFVGEGGTHYFFSASSPGLSDFVTGVKQAKFRIDDAIVSVTSIRTGEGVDILVRVTNVGGADGTYDVELILEEAVVDHRALSIAPNGTRQVTFERSFADPGTYELYVNERFVANVSVARVESTTTETDGSGRLTGAGETGIETPGFGVVSAVVALVVAALGLTLGRRLR